MKSRHFDQHSLQKLISSTLRTGVFLASTIGILGGALYLAQHGNQTASFHHFAGTQTAFASPKAVVHNLAGTDSTMRDLAVMQIGILVLLLTPIVRVALSIVGFALERDRMYVAITSVVLLTLMASIFLR